MSPATTSRSSRAADTSTSSSPATRRPAARSKRYRASADDSRLAFLPRRDDLLATLLARALERLPVDEAREIAHEVGLEYGPAMAARMEPTEGHRSVKAAVASVADALTAHGFAAHAETRGNALTLVAEHCPFGEAARQYPHVLCRGRHRHG